jgi:gas vesicle protein
VVSHRIGITAMAFLLFFLCVGSITALILASKQLQQRKEENRLLQQQIEESNRRLQDANQKYGGLISREESIRTLDNQIAALTEQSKRLNEQFKVEEYEISTSIAVLKTELQELEEQDFVEAFGFYDSKYDFQESSEYKQRLDLIRTQQKQKIKDKIVSIACNHIP